MSAAEQLDTSNWPDSLLAIAAVIGDDAAWALASHTGGLRGIYVARRATRTHAWVHVIGLDAYTRLCKAFGGQKIDIPRAAFARLKKREIIELAEANPDLSRRAIALRAHCTEGYVQSVLKGFDHDRQPSLPGLGER